VALGNLWSKLQNWYQTEFVKAIYFEYQREIDKILAQNPKLKDQVVKCRQCHIPFITAASNRNRSDLLCPMGCQDHVHRTKSNQRSANYYRDAVGKQKKKEQNKKRAKNRSPPIQLQNSIAPQQNFIMKRYLKFLIHLLKKIWLKKTELNRIYHDIQNTLRQHPLTI